AQGVQARCPASLSTRQVDSLALIDQIGLIHQLTECETQVRRRLGMFHLSLQPISVALGDSARADIPTAPGRTHPGSDGLGRGVVQQPGKGVPAAFDRAASQVMTLNPQLAGEKYPDQFHWEAAVDAERRRVRT